MHAADVALFHAINGWSSRWAPLFVFLSEATKHAPGRIGLLAIAALLIAAGPTTRKAALLAILAVLVANTFADGLKVLLGMRRPCVELPDAILRVGMLDSFGSASSHAANMAALAFTFTRYFKWWGTPWIALALLTGIARIYVGVHYPSQILLGLVVGTVSAFIVTQTWQVFVRRRSLDRLQHSR